MDIYLIESIIYYVVLTCKVKQIKCVSFGTPTEIKFRIIGTGLTDTHNIFKADMPILLLFYSWSIASQCSIEHSKKKHNLIRVNPKFIVRIARLPFGVPKCERDIRFGSLWRRARVYDHLSDLCGLTKIAPCVYICARARRMNIFRQSREFQFSSAAPDRGHRAWVAELCIWCQEPGNTTERERERTQENGGSWGCSFAVVGGGRFPGSNATRVRFSRRRSRRKIGKTSLSTSICIVYTSRKLCGAQPKSERTIYASHTCQVNQAWSINGGGGNLCVPLLVKMNFYSNYFYRHKYFKYALISNQMNILYMRLQCTTKRDYRATYDICTAQNIAVYFYR